MTILRFILTLVSAFLALISWLFIIGLAGGLGDVYMKLILDEHHQLPPASVVILVPSMLFFLALFFEHLPCLKNYGELGLRTFYVTAIWAWVIGMVVNSALVVAISFKDEITPMPIEVGFDEVFSAAAALALILPAAVIRLCATIQCHSYGSKNIRNAT